jgi:hypothetical protein
MREIEMLAVVEMSENFGVRVPDDMSDEAILAAVKEALNLKEAEILHRSSAKIAAPISHEVTADGDVILLDDDFDFQWEIER